ncbi:MAG TPA: DUF222 domain-containing protein [Nitriliruptoraceae bacterium]|nr:DUF222 domain-containing protein [Nitriliruptoraceae bacterium]
MLHVVTDRGGDVVGLAMPAGSGGTGAGTVEPAEMAADPNRSLRDAMALVRWALAATPTDVGQDPVAALRNRVELLEQLTGQAAAGLAATLSALRRTGAFEADGAPSTAAWVKANTSRSARDAARTARLADNLDELPATTDALASGQLTPEAADAVVQAARDPRLGGPQQVEADLLELATTHPPEQLRADILRRQQTADGATMLRDERRQHAARRASLTRADSGMWNLYAELPDEIGQQVATALDAFDHPDPGGTPTLQRRRPEQRRADALAALVGAALDRGLAPGTGGIARPHISVIVPAPTFIADLDGLEAGDTGGGSEDPDDMLPVRVDDPAWARLPAGDLGWGGRLSPQAVRRICCDADVTRIIMTPDSQVLDVGRATRTWSQPQRRAINARDRHCRGPTCTRPIGWTQIHHIRWWKRDRGPTDLDNGIALCMHCHHLVHDRGWSVSLEPATAAATWTSPTGAVTVTSPPAQPTDPWAPTVETNAPAPVH